MYGEGRITSLTFRVRIDPVLIVNFFALFVMTKDYDYLFVIGFVGNLTSINYRSQKMQVVSKNSIVIG